MRLWLTRQRQGDYMLSYRHPVMMEVNGAGEVDAYIEPGEPIGVRHLCPGGVRALIGRDLEVLESVRVDLSMREIEKSR